MPKGHRSVRSQGYYRLSPVTTPTTIPTQYAPISTRQTIPNSYYNTPQGPLTSTSNMSQQSYQQGPANYSNGGPVQLPMNQQYTQMPPAPVSIRPSSGAWTPSDDQTLMAARAQGMNWAPIQQMYFPSKTPNACRKRHERLMERRSADDWDGLKLENLAKNYMGMRREIWSALAAQTGEKWNVVEQKVCFFTFHFFPLSSTTARMQESSNSTDTYSKVHVPRSQEPPNSRPLLRSPRAHARPQFVLRQPLTLSISGQLQRFRKHRRLRVRGRARS